MWGVGSAGGGCAQRILISQDSDAGSDHFRSWHILTSLSLSVKWTPVDRPVNSSHMCSHQLHTKLRSRNYTRAQAKAGCIIRHIF